MLALYFPNAKTSMKITANLSNLSLLNITRADIANKMKNRHYDKILSNIRKLSQTMYSFGIINKIKSQQIFIIQIKVDIFDNEAKYQLRSNFNFQIIFIIYLQRTHSSAVHVRQRAETLLQTNHFDPAGVKEIADNVTNR